MRNFLRGNRSVPASWEVSLYISPETWDSFLAPLNTPNMHQELLSPNSIHAPSTLQSQEGLPWFSCSPRAVAISPSFPQSPQLTVTSARIFKQLWTKMKEVTAQHLIKSIIGNTRAHFSALFSPGNASTGVCTLPLALSFKAVLGKLEKVKRSTIKSEEV